MSKGSRNRTIDRKAYENADYWKHLPTPWHDFKEKVRKNIIKQTKNGDKENVLRN